MKWWNGLPFSIRRLGISKKNLTYQELEELKMMLCLARSLTGQLLAQVAIKDWLTFKEWQWTIMFGTDFHSENKEKDCLSMELDSHTSFQTWETASIIPIQTKPVQWPHQRPTSKPISINNLKPTLVAFQKQMWRKTKEVALPWKGTPITLLVTTSSKVLMTPSSNKMVILSLQWNREAPDSADLSTLMVKCQMAEALTLFHRLTKPVANKGLSDNEENEQEQYNVSILR